MKLVQLRNHRENKQTVQKRQQQYSRMALHPQERDVTLVPNPHQLAHYFVLSHPAIRNLAEGDGYAQPS